MQTYVILRRNAWQTPADLQASAARSTAVGNAMPNDVRWIRSYVVKESVGPARDRVHLPGFQRGRRAGARPALRHEGGRDPAGGGHGDRARRPRLTAGKGTGHLVIGFA